MVFGKTQNVSQMTSNIVLGIVGILVLAALLPTAVSSLINLTTSVFAGTVFEPIFSGGLVVYGVLTVGMIALIFKLFSNKV